MVLFSVAAVCLAVMVGLIGAEGALRVRELFAPRAVRLGTGAEPSAPGNPTPLQLRGPRYTFEPGQLRVVTVGDSFTWGDGIWSDADVWANRLETLLGERLGRDTGVVNLAIRGDTAVACARNLRTYGMPLDPDLIVYGFYINDALRNFPDGRCLLWDYNLYDTLLDEPIHTWAKTHCLLYEHLSAAWMAYQIRTDPVGWNRHYTKGTVEWEQFSAALRQMAAMGWETNAPVVMVLWPDWGVGPIDTAHYKWHELYAHVAAAGRGYGMHVVDLTPAFATIDRPAKTWCLTANDCHPSVEAHHIGAETVADYVVACGLAQRWMVASASAD